MVTINKLLKLRNCIPRLQLLHTFGTSRTTISADPVAKINDIQHVHSAERLLKIAIIGAPNSGKSTLINQMVKRRVFPISKKVHTTQYRAKAVHNEDNIQLIFLDTPGLVTVTETQKYKLSSEYVTGGEDAIAEADVIGVVHDLSNHFTRKQLDPKVLRLLHIYNQKESCLILNKIDTIKSKRKLLDLTKALTGGQMRDNRPLMENSFSEKNIQDIIKEKGCWEHFSHVFMISALFGTGTEELMNYLLKSAHSNAWLFPEDAFTDQKPIALIKETVRSKLLEHLPQEIPYNLVVEIEYLDLEQTDGVTCVVIIKCKNPKIENIVKGFGGKRIRKIAIDAEQTLCDTFYTNFRLKLVICNKQL